MGREPAPNVGLIRIRRAIPGLIGGFEGTGLGGGCSAVYIWTCVTLRLGKGAGEIRGECVLAVVNTAHEAWGQHSPPSMSPASPADDAPAPGLRAGRN